MPTILNKFEKDGSTLTPLRGETPSAPLKGNGVIPINKDPELLKYPKKEMFWDKVKRWKNKGWEITMHGCNHLYTQKSDKKDIFNYGGNSEFYGLDYSEQLKKIKIPCWWV